MSDASAVAHAGALRALDAQRDAFDRYARLLDAQQAALQAGDLSLVDSLTERTGTLLREILAHSSHFNELYDAVALNGDPGSAAELRPLLSEVVRRAQQATADVRRLEGEEHEVVGHDAAQAESQPARPPAYDERQRPTGRKPVIDRRG